MFPNLPPLQPTGNEGVPSPELKAIWELNTTIHAGNTMIMRELEAVEANILNKVAMTSYDDVS